MKLAQNCDYYALGVSIPILDAVHDCHTAANYGAFGQALIAANTPELNQTFAEIANRMAALRDDLSWYFQHLNKYQPHEDCYRQYLSDQQTVISGAQELQKYLAGEANSFRTFCALNRCLDATERLVDSIDSKTGDCRVLYIVNQGYAPAAFFEGWLDQINSKGGYIYALANLGVTVQSAFQEKTGKGSLPLSLIFLFDSVQRSF